ncbi:MAG TPA: hypothetical protein VJ247_01080 [Gaiella sp.]|jgi:hypothetical protein|nr:hypothetical protein [Gaiella sp.]
MTLIRPSLRDILLTRRAPAIWPHGRGLEGQARIPAATMQGIVTVELIHARTGLVKRRLRFPNLITNAGLDKVAANTKPLGLFLGNGGYLGVGTGSTAPAVTDVALVAATGVRTNSVGGGTTTFGFGAANAYSFWLVAREFSETQSNGNLTEFGLFDASTAGTMFVRQLFRDEVGNPTTIVKTSDDKLRVIYEFRLYPPTVDAAGVVTINAVNYNWTSRICNGALDTAWGVTSGFTGLLNWMGGGNPNCEASNHTTLGSTTSVGPTGGTQTASKDSFVNSAYTNGSFLYEVSHVWNPGTANFTNGVRAFRFQPWSSGASFSHQMVLDAFIPKVNTQRLTLTFQFQLGRHALP